MDRSVSVTRKVALLLLSALGGTDLLASIDAKVGNGITATELESSVKELADAIENTSYLSKIGRQG